MITADKVIEAYIRLRDQKDAVAKRHKEELAPFTEAMGKLETWLHQQLLEQGLQNFKSSIGVAYFSTHTAVKVDDWIAALDWIKQHNAWDLLERRISKTAYEDYQKAGTVPPGVASTSSQVVRVQRQKE
jgi:hypothetical protein